MSTSVDDETILDVLRSNDAPRMTTTEVAGQLPVTRGTTRTRLQGLADDDLLERTTEGNNVVWWLPEREEELDAWEDAQADEAAASEADPDDDEESETADEENADEKNADEGDETDDEEADDENADEKNADEADDEEADDTESSDDGIEVEAVDDTGDTDDTSEDDGGDATTVEVEAVSEDGSEDDATASEEELPELSDDDEGLRAVAAVAVALVAAVLLRRLLGGD